MKTWLVAAAACVALGAGLVPLTALPAAAAGPCDPPVTNRVACENTLPGTPDSDWMISGSGDQAIQGFGTDVSVQAGGTMHFKIDTPATAYHIDIIRLGYYGGAGGRKVAAGIHPTATLPQTQPPCLYDAPTGLTDCGNWSESASWTVPNDAVSGIYLAHLVRDDVASAGSHILFTVRDDSSHSDIIYQTDDTTRNAYNRYGGNSLYFCTTCPPGTNRAAFKVSFNRPYTGADLGSVYSVFAAEYQMIMWLERNGYDVSYQSGVDTDRLGASVLEQHETFMSSGHDEYWSGGQRANVEAARDAGVNLAFFSGNESFWKIRYENGTGGTSYRTEVSYKETFDDAHDPADPPTWTGTWRDTRSSPPADGGRPENSMTGTIYMVNSPNSFAIEVPAADGKMRFWRNTSVANLGAGQLATLAPNTLGYEWDSDLDNGSRPAGLFHLSSTTKPVNALADQQFGVGQHNGIATHNLTTYRAPSGALVFGAGTVQWSWGLSGAPDGTPADPRMQQATVNLLADMGAQPATLQSGLVAATASTDTTAPTSTITSPASGTAVTNGSSVTVSGTAADVGGQVAGVEVSTDNGQTWHPAVGRGSWTYSWNVQTSGNVTIRARAVDDSGNLQQNGPSVPATANCPCQLFPNASAPSMPASLDYGGPLDVGVRFTSDTNGTITALRFYKDPANTGTHIGSLWTAAGALLAQATFVGETASGWQQVILPQAVPITAGATYVASYHNNATYSSTPWQFTNGGSVNSGPLHAPPDSPSAPNGVYGYGASPTFPAGQYQGYNYWVDVVYSDSSSAPDTTPPTVVAQSPAPGATGVPVSTTVTATFSETVQQATINVTVAGQPNQPVAGTTNVQGNLATFTPSANLAAGTNYTATVSAAQDLAGNVMSAPVNWSFMTQVPSACPCYLWPASTTPTTVDAGDGASVELGVKFSADTSGFVSGIRYYKAAANSGTHSGTLWSSSGTLLATATFTGESASGWQQVAFSQPVAVTAGTTYVASYHTNTGHYSFTDSYFSVPLDNAPLHAPTTAASGGNGVFRYGASAFPNGTYRGGNYWVSPTYTGSGSPAPTAPDAPTGVTATAGNGQASVSWTAPAANGSAITSYTVTPFIGTTAQTSKVVSGSPPATSTTVTGLTNGTTYTFTVKATNGVGTGPASAASNAVTPSSGASVPGAPTGVSATAGNGQASVSWTAPAANGSAITSYTVTPFIGTTAQTTKVVSGSPPATSTIVTGLTNGTAYTFTVKATNGVGTGPASSASNAVTPGAVPGAPTGVTATAGNGQASVSWTAPAANGSAITSYTVTPFIGTTAQTTKVVSGSPPATSTTVTGLTNGTAYTFTVTATNGVGTGPASSASNAVTPGAVPGAPSGVTATAGNGQASVSWTAPAANGSAITSYTVTPFIGTTAQTTKVVSGSPPATSTTVTGLTNGTTYTFTVTATNGVGAGPASSASNAVTPTASTPTCPCSLWSSAVTPSVVDEGDAASVNLGVKFSADTSGFVTGIRFYKSAANTGTHTGTLFDLAGNSLATATFTNETATGWQQVTFGSPVAVTAGTTYIASYHTNTGHYSYNGNYFAVPLDNSPLHAPTSAASGGNGLYRYGATAVPNQTYQAANYWVSPVFSPGAVSPTAPDAPTSVSAAAGDAQATVSWTAPAANGSAITSYTVTPLVGITPQTPTVVSGTPPLTSTTISGLANGTTYTFVVTATNGVGTGPVSAPSNAVTPSSSTPTCPCALWPTSTTPSVVDDGDTASVNLGVKFSADTNGFVTGIRFYKSAANTGTHTGTLFDLAGNSLATATFTNETATGWQQVTFSSPVAITAGTTYIASYHTNVGHYSYTGNYFLSPLDNQPLHAPTSALSGGNGLYRYGATAVPNQTYQAANYWVTPVFAP